MAETPVKVTLRELIGFINAANSYQQRFPAPTKLSYALARMVKRGLKFTAKMDEAMDDERQNHALAEEKTGALLRDERNQFKFDKAGMKAVVTKNKELVEEEVEIEPYYTTVIPVDLANDFRVAFEGFVIRPGQEASEPPEAQAAEPA